jgi:hypothetical protein
VIGAHRFMKSSLSAKQEIPARTTLCARLDRPCRCLACLLLP